MAPPRSTLSGSLVPTESPWASASAGQRKGKYVSSLDASLQPRDAKPPPEPKPPAAPSQLGVGGLVPRTTAPPAPAEPPQAAAPAAPLRRADLAGASVPAPAEATAPFAAPRRCMYTGDDLPPDARPLRRPTGRDEAWEIIKRGDGRVGRAGRTIFNQEDAPPPSGEPETLRHLREWKTRMVMPERLDMHSGFAVSPVTARDADLDAAWANEVEHRQWAHGQDRIDKQRQREETEREVQNRAVSAYGEALPRRGKGDVFAPFAPRMF